LASAADAGIGGSKGPNLADKVAVRAMTAERVRRTARSLSSAARAIAAAPAALVNSSPPTYDDGGVAPGATTP
jgi:hypothetical protein